MNSKHNTYSLFVSYFHVQDELRARELVECLERNLQNSYISKIFVLFEYCKNDEAFYKDKLPDIMVDGVIDVIFVRKKQPRSISYLDFIKHANLKLDPGQKFIIANTDIFFDDTLSETVALPQGDAVYALTRYNVEPYLNVAGGIWQRSSDSQDSWFFECPFPENKEFDINLGWIGCDNRIAYELDKAGFRVLNISETIKTWHLHKETQHVQLYDNGYSYLFSGLPYMRVELETLEKVLAKDFVYDSLSDMRRSTFEAQLRCYHTELDNICRKHGLNLNVRSRQQNNGLKNRLKGIITRWRLRARNLLGISKPGQ